jgi:hypothetical protein
MVAAAPSGAAVVMGRCGPAAASGVSAACGKLNLERPAVTVAGFQTMSLGRKRLGSHSRGRPAFVSQILAHGAYGRFGLVVERALDVLVDVHTGVVKVKNERLRVADTGRASKHRDYSYVTIQK